MTRWRDKDPDATVPYAFDLSRYFETVAPGDSLATVSVSAAPAGLVVFDAEIDGTSVPFWASGGAHGTNYIVTLHFTTAAGLTDQASQALFVAET